MFLVTDDTDWTNGLPVDVILQTTPRLDGAIDDALRFAHGRTGIILGDLPGLGSAELDRALSRASDTPLGMVADAHGTGTTLITATEASAHRPRFGTDSANSHRKFGYRDLDIPCGSGLRFDVDTIDDLLCLDWPLMGPLTAAVLRRSGLSMPLAATRSSTTSSLPTPSRTIGAPL